MAVTGPHSPAGTTKGVGTCGLLDQASNQHLVSSMCRTHGNDAESMKSHQRFLGTGGQSESLTSDQNARKAGKCHKKPCSEIQLVSLSLEMVEIQ